MIIEKLDSLDFIDANKMITNFTNSTEIISNEDLKLILKLKDYELISTFFEKYDRFKGSQLELIEDFINKKLDIEDRDFVSDLIDFSSDWALNLNYKKILQFLFCDEEKEHFVVLSTINYITENTKLFYVKEIIKGMQGILDNPKFFQNVQISGALCLFRITQDESYLLEIKDWFTDDSNKEFLNNKLKLDYYKEDYFCDIKSKLL